MQYIKRMTAAACLACTVHTAIARADTTFSDYVPAIGCYKENGSDLCVETTRIHCGGVYDKPLSNEARQKQLARNVARYGAVIASFCDDLQWMSEQAIADGTELQKLKKEIARLKRRR